MGAIKSVNQWSRTEGVQCLQYLGDDGEAMGEVGEYFGEEGLIRGEAG